MPALPDAVRANLLNQYNQAMASIPDDGKAAGVDAVITNDPGIFGVETADSPAN